MEHPSQRVVFRCNVRVKCFDRSRGRSTEVVRMTRMMTVSRCCLRAVYERLEAVGQLGKSCNLSSVVCSVRNGWKGRWVLASNVSFGVYNVLPELRLVKREQPWIKHIPQAIDVRW